MKVRKQARPTVGTEFVPRGGSDWTGARGSQLGAGNVLERGLGEGYPGACMCKNPSSCSLEMCVFHCMRKDPCLFVSV